MLPDPERPRVTAPPHSRMPPETRTGIHRVVSQLSPPYTKEKLLAHVGDAQVPVGEDQRFVLRTALSMVPEGVFHTPAEVSEAINARWDDVKGLVY